jgi:hypothetical protein
MKLPESPWLSLQEALHWLTERGASEELAKERLCLALRDEEIEAWGRWRNSGVPERSKISPYAFGLASIRWDSSSISFLELGFVGRPETKRFNDVEVRRDSLAKWLKEGAEFDASYSQTVGSQAGESPLYRSPYMKLMLAAEAKFGTRLTSSQDYAKKEEIEDWLKKNWAELVPAKMTDNLIKSMATLIRDPELGKGGNRRTK